MKPRKFGSSMFGNKGRPATGAAVNKPKMQRGKKAFFSEGGGTTVAERERKYMDPTKLEDEDKAKAEAPKAEAPKSKELSQADIDKMSYGEAFKHFRAQGAGTKFTYKGSKQAAYRSGEEPESFKRNAAKPKTEAPKTEAPKADDSKPSAAGGPRRGTGPARPDFTTSPAGGPRRMPGRIPPSAAGGPRRGEQREGKYREQYTFTDLLGQKHDVEFPRGTPMEKVEAESERRGYAKGGTVKSKSMNMGGMAGYKSGGSCGSGMKKYAEGGAVPSAKKPYVPTAADRNEKAGGDQEMENRSQTRGAGRGPMSRNGMKPKMYARGGGVESHGKTKGSMVKMASGGSVSSRADGVASKGKTNCKIC